ncbi:MAG: SDR family NAD(P)-dependent oxidoreductase [Clostridiales bacterium]|jgi:NAD(P)-dependent dehydrogenase (short-subunit alcohol dehydrogenase family)|nr:SDR family NAD(P)-dependent oxidoreductase [Clostridiales bacterium]
MRTIVITGGASGLGRGIAANFAKVGERVIAIGSSAKVAADFPESAVYIQADLSLVSENLRVVNEIKARFPVVDMLIFCASRHCKEYIETAEGFEFSFALDYLSRFILSHGLKESLEAAENPAILNICGTGMGGAVNWDDLQHKNSFVPQKVMMHGSRLNDLSAVAFAKNDKVSKIKYILYNPMAVKTPGMMEFSGVAMKFIYKIMGKSIEQAAAIISELLENPPEAPLAAYRQRKPLSLAKPTYSPENAERLYGMTKELLENFGL